MRVAKKLRSILLVAIFVLGSFAASASRVFAATGGGTATIGVDGGSQGAGVSVVQATSHVYTTVFTVNTSGLTLGASSPTFAIPTGLTAPTTHAVANTGLVNADGKWSVAGSGGTCAVDSSPVSSTTVASGQTITVDVTADCAVGNTITLTYQGTSAGTMAATQLVVSTADAGDTSPVTPLIAGSPTITVTATLSPSPTPSSTPTPTPAAASNNSGSSSTGSTGGNPPCVSATITSTPIILESKRVSPTAIFLSWGPDAGPDTFNIQYGLKNGDWAYNTNVTGFSTTINDLPPQQPIWLRIATRNNCYIGTYGETRFVGEPTLPRTGFAPANNPFQQLLRGFLSFLHSL